MTRKTSTRMVCSLMVLAAAFGLAPAAWAGETAPAPEAKAAAVKPEVPPAMAAPPPASIFDEMDLWIDKSKAPFPWFKWGADLRFRDEYFNAAGLNSKSPVKGTKGDETNWQRIRARWWTTVTPVKDVDLNLRIEWEGRHWSAPDGTPTWAKEQVLLDTLNLKFTNFLGTPLTMVLGRQDIILGDGWLAQDGTSLDGSRTTFFDAARFSFAIPNASTVVDLIFIDNKHRGNAIVPPLLSFKTNLIEQDERSLILWVANRSIPNTEIDGYYMYKDSDSIAGVSGTEDSFIHTFGARIAGELSDHWKYRAEGATQFGRRNDQYLRAFGFNSRLTYLAKDALNNQFRTSFEYLSGDEPGTTGTNEGWVPLWGRWPQWSELYVYTVAFTGESRIAEVNDIYRLAFGWTCNPTKKLELNADYHLLFAPQNQKQGTAGFSESGAFRGQLLTFLANYTFTKHLKGHILTEFFFPGNYYTSPKDDIATMLRGELYFTW